MAKSKPPYVRISWEDRFNRPTVKQLRDCLFARDRPSFDRCRKNLLGLEGVSESLSWHGASWKWTIEFRTKHSTEPLCLLVPSPLDLQFAVPLDREFVNSLAVNRMKRAVRDGLELAREPFDTRWGIWSLQGTNLVDDLQVVVVSKLRHLSRAVG